MKTVEYLDAIKARHGITSDYALAKLLATRQTTVSNYRRRGGGFDPTMAVKVAELLELDPLQVIADAELERATDDSTRDMWRRISAKIAAPAVLLLFLGGLLPPPAGASPGLGAFDITHGNSPIYRLSANAARRRLAAFLVEFARLLLALSTRPPALR